MSESSRTQSFKDEEKAAERKRLARVLLNRPWVRKADDPELFRTLRLHYEPLREWFQHACGFPLLMTRELIKLEKVPGVAKPWMGVVEFKQPLDYALFTFCLWFLQNKGEMEQFVLSELIDSVKLKMQEEGTPLEMTHTPHRQSLKRALKKLRDLKILIVVDGDEEDWARSKEGTRNILYECSTLTSYVLRRFPQDISALTEFRQLGEGMYPEGNEGDVSRRRHTVFRRLLQEPAVLDHHWQPDELQYVRIQRSYILEQIGKHVGLEGKRYREGLLFYHLSPKGEMDLFPTAESITDLVLLLANEVRTQLKEKEDLQITQADLESMLLDLRETYGSCWSKQDREAKIGELAQQLLGHLEAWGLAERVDPNWIRLSSVLGRFSGSYKLGGDER
ncbi:TIGR02678 family protein [Tumebacillus sp. ITR2]|uniref:TIGR02678 family protein n=1 Tax=Tumebacillus amylolyticus TaxID=2801339 RepID=A0ABS1JGS8_9BACL|nr:TIGR02678 family protein [Tumebacillus amylolyticus]MBL0389481.1 TIGR02678 family protein [Tumebacillus amylolyticus]